MTKLLVSLLVLALLAGGGFWYFSEYQTASVNLKQSLVDAQKVVKKVSSDTPLREDEASTNATTDQALEVKTTAVEPEMSHGEREAHIAALSHPDKPSLGNRTRKLWELEADREPVDERIEGYPIRLSIAELDTLQTGNHLSVPIPGASTPLKASISSTHNQLGKVKVWQGPIQVGEGFDINGSAYEGHAQDNVIVSRGETATHVTVVTRVGTYTAVIDNQTGKGHLVDESDYVAIQDYHHNDAISVPFTPTQPQDE